MASDDCYFALLKWCPSNSKNHGFTYFEKKISFQNKVILNDENVRKIYFHS